MSNQELPLNFTIQRYINDYIAGGGQVEFSVKHGWENRNFSVYLSDRLIAHGWIDNE